MTARVILQGKQRFFREALSIVLESEPDVTVVGAVEDAAGLTRLCAANRPDAVILELDVEEWDPCRLAAALRKRHRALQVIGICDERDREVAQRAFRSGIRCVLSRSTPMATLLHALRVGTARTPVVHLHSAGSATGMTTYSPLTDRQLEVLELIATGMTTREIANRLGISAKTVEHHKERIFERLGVHNQSHAVAIAIRRGLFGVSAGLVRGAL